MKVIWSSGSAFGPETIFHYKPTDKMLFLVSWYNFEKKCAEVPLMGFKTMF